MEVKKTLSQSAPVCVWIIVKISVAIMICSSRDGYWICLEHFVMLESSSRQVDYRRHEIYEAEKQNSRDQCFGRLQKGLMNSKGVGADQSKGSHEYEIHKESSSQMRTSVRMPRASQHLDARSRKTWMWKLRSQETTLGYVLQQRGVPRAVRFSEVTGSGDVRCTSISVRRCIDGTGDGSPLENKREGRCISSTWRSNLSQRKTCIAI